MLIARFLKFDWPPDIIPLAIISFNRDVYAKLRFLDVSDIFVRVSRCVKQTVMQ